MEKTSKEMQEIPEKTKRSIKEDQFDQEKEKHICTKCSKIDMPGSQIHRTM